MTTQAEEKVAGAAMKAVRIRRTVVSRRPRAVQAVALAPAVPTCPRRRDPAADGREAAWRRSQRLKAAPWLLCGRPLAMLWTLPLQHGRTLQCLPASCKYQALRPMRCVLPQELEDSL